MPEIFNKDNIDPETLSDGALRRVLLDDTITSNDNIRLDHWDLGSGVPYYPLRGAILPGFRCWTERSSFPARKALTHLATSI